MLERTKKVETKLHGTPHEHIKLLQKHKIPYILSYTTSSAILKTEHEKLVFAEDRITNLEHKLRNQLKKEIKDRVKNIVKNEYTPLYYRWSEHFAEFRIKPQESIEAKNVWEVDLTKAYYYSAYILGYISEDFFNKTLTLPKKIRLRLLGSIATIKNIETFDGEEIDYEKVYDPLFRTVWHNVSCKVDIVMSDIANALGDHFLFYWVDGIYFTTFGELDTCSHIAEGIAYHHNFEIHKTKLDKIKVKNMDGYLHAEIWKGNDCKIFCVANKSLNDI